MPNTIETTIYHKGLFPFNELYNIIESKGVNINIKEIFTIDNWEFDNTVKYECDYKKFDYDKQLINGKIIFVLFSINDFSSGMHACMVDDNTTEICFWVHTKESGYLDINAFTDLSHPIYDEITNSILQSSFVNSIIIAAIGFETAIDYDPDIQSIIDSGVFIVRWIVPTAYTVRLDSAYKVKRTREYDVYYLT